MDLVSSREEAGKLMRAKPCGLTFMHQIVIYGRVSQRVRQAVKTTQVKGTCAMHAK